MMEHLSEGLAVRVFETGYDYVQRKFLSENRFGLDLDLWGRSGMYIMVFGEYPLDTTYYPESMKK